MSISQVPPSTPLPSSTPVVLTESLSFWFVVSCMTSKFRNSVLVAKMMGAAARSKPKAEGLKSSPLVVYAVMSTVKATPSTLPRLTGFRLRIVYAIASSTSALTDERFDYDGRSGRLASGNPAGHEIAHEFQSGGDKSFAAIERLGEVTALANAFVGVVSVQVQVFGWLRSSLLVHEVAFTDFQGIIVVLGIAAT